MGFSSGASRAKRKARQAAAAEYYKAFAKLNALPDVGRIATNNKRQVEESLGDNASFRTRNLSQKADRMARAINKDDDYKGKVSQYNDRYSILKGQIANKGSVRYSVSNTPRELPKKITIGLGGNVVTVGAAGGNPIGVNGLINNIAPIKPQSSFASGVNVSATKEGAMADAIKRMEEYNKANAGKLVKKPANKGPAFMANNVKFQPITDPTRFIQEENFQPFNVLYRNLNVAESAANDLNALSKNLNSSTGNKNIEAYAALSEKLKPLIKKDARNIQTISGNQSLVSGELASANPYTETIS